MYDKVGISNAVQGELWGSKLLWLWYCDIQCLHHVIERRPKIYMISVCRIAGQDSALCHLQYFNVFWYVCIPMELMLSPPPTCMCLGLPYMWALPSCKNRSSALTCSPLHHIKTHIQFWHWKVFFTGIGFRYWMFEREGGDSQGRLPHERADLHWIQFQTWHFCLNKGISWLMGEWWNHHCLVEL